MKNQHCIILFIGYLENETFKKQKFEWWLPGAVGLKEKEIVE